MKKAIPYIIGAAFLIVIGLIVISGRKKSQRIFDERITLKTKDKIPYGLSAAKKLLPSLFSNADIYTEDKAPGSWLNLSNYENNQAAIFIARKFNADEFELDQLLNFVREGNHVLIAADNFSDESKKVFGFGLCKSMWADYSVNFVLDSISVRLEKGPFSSDSMYSFPGRKYENCFSYVDTAHTVVLGRDKQGIPNFIQLKMGAGTVSIHAAPIAFSNYFLLHKNNVAYFQNAFSVLPGNVSTIVWDDYYLNKKTETPPTKSSPFRVLLKYPAFKWGFLVAALTLFLYLLFYMRRRQRFIPGHEKPKNDSLDFVKTMGRLYYERKDHKNLAQKMTVYFLEHVRSDYKIATHLLDEEFEKLLHYKSGYPMEGIDNIVSFIRYLKSGGAVTEAQLAKFHSQLESFYQNT